jgi:hypothetical protein
MRFNRKFDSLDLERSDPQNIPIPAPGILLQQIHLTKAAFLPEDIESGFGACARGVV